jgi:hypothetical protein
MLQSGLRINDLKDANPQARALLHKRLKDMTSETRRRNDLDEETWAIRYLLVNTSNWWLGHEVLIAPEWIDHIWLGGIQSGRWLDSPSGERRSAL